MIKRKWKTAIVLGLVLVVAIVVVAAIKRSRSGVITVQTGKVSHMDLTSIVTASGEVKPRNYINIGTNAQAPAPITALYVKEGDHVKKGQLLARLAAVQPGADLRAQRAALNSAEANSSASEASLKSADDNIAVAQATVAHDRADLEQKQVDLKRAKELYDAKLIASQDYEAKKAAYDLAKAMLQSSESKVSQAKAQRAQSAAQLSASQIGVAQSQAMVARSADILHQYEAVAPLDGVVTNLPVRVGETVVPGIQNSASSTIMTIADMSIITAEVDVDETDIVNVRLNEPAEVTIDAFPDKKFKGHVMEIGNTAIIRSSGVAASQSQTSSSEAKDFKVTIALDIPESLVRPGLSCTAKITTATRQNALAVPIQALTMRQAGQLVVTKPGAKPQQPMDEAAQKAAKQEFQGVFVVENGKAVFHKVETGITGATDIEILKGLKPGEQIVTGNYQVLRTLRNDAKVKVDNQPANSPRPV